MENSPSSLSSELGVVLSGGGTRSAYQVGAMRALAEHHGVTAPKVLVAISAGKGVGMFYLAGRFDDMYAWADKFDDPRFISFWRVLRGHVIDTNFLVDGIFKEQCPALPQHLEAVKTKWFLGATRFPDVTPHWFSNQDGTGNIFEILRAGKSIPGISGNEVSLNGNIFGDGVPTISMSDCVAKAFAEGAKKVLVIDNGLYGETSWLLQTFMRWRTRNLPPHARALTKKMVESARCGKPLPPSPNLYICRREDLASTHFTVRDKNIGRRTMQQGYEDVANLVFA